MFDDEFVLEENGLPSEVRLLWIWGGIQTEKKKKKRKVFEKEQDKKEREENERRQAILSPPSCPDCRQATVRRGLAFVSEVQVSRRMCELVLCRSGHAFAPPHLAMGLATECFSSLLPFSELCYQCLQVIRRRLVFPF